MPRFGFFSLLPTTVLEQIDDVVSMEVTPYIKTMGALPQAIQIAATKAAQSESGEMYLENLARAWRRHNDLALEIDVFLVELYTGRRSLLETSTIQQARAFLPRAFKTEDEKRIYSVGVKLALDTSIERAREKYSLTEEQQTLLLSSWVPDFWTYRLHAHAEYVREKLSGRSTEEMGHSLASTFHASERILLEKRLPRILGERHLTKEGTEGIIAHCVEAEGNIHTLATRGCYLAMGRPDLKAIQRLVQYDNGVEYLFSSNMFGVPDFFFRKVIAHFLVSVRLLEERPSVVFYDQNELDNGLRQLEETDDGSWQQHGRGLEFAPDISPNHPNHLWRGVRDDSACSLSRSSSH